MHNLLTDLTAHLADVTQSFAFFKPEIYLTVLFVLLIVTDLFFGKDSTYLCRIIAFSGILMIALLDIQQNGLLQINDGNKGHFFFSQLLLLTSPAIKFKVIIDLLAFILIIYFKWDNNLKSHSKGLTDFYSIAIAAVFGLHLMVMAVSLISLYLGIEIISIASYIMVAYRTENIFGTEAGLKYVLFGAASSAIMLFGMSLLYAFTGALNLFSPDFIEGMVKVNPVAASCAILLVLTGIGFKLSFIPFHFWVPDVYEGAPTPVTAWLSTLPKIAAFAVLINFLTPFIFFAKWTSFDFRLFLSIVAIGTMLAGNFAALLQTNIKRMLAYSSIGHTGFVLMAVITFNANGISALMFYLAVYGVANIGSLMLCSYFVNIAGASNLEEYKGLGKLYPLASICFLIMLISLAGLPITAGFTGKLFVFSAVYSEFALNHNIWLLLLMITGALTTVISLAYYIKIPLYLFLKKQENSSKNFKKSNNILVLASILCILIILLGVLPKILY